MMSSCGGRGFGDREKILRCCVRAFRTNNASRNYSRLCLNPYLSVDTKKYGLLQSMGFGRAHLRAIFFGHIMLYYVLNDYILSKYNNYEAN